MRSFNSLVLRALSFKTTSRCLAQSFRFRFSDKSAVGTGEQGVGASSSEVANRLADLQRRLSKLVDQKQKDRYFENEVLGHLSKIDGDSLDAVLTYLKGPWKCGKLPLARIVLQATSQNYALNDLERTTILALMDQQASPKKLAEFLDVIKCLQILKITAFPDHLLSEFRQLLQSSKSEYDILQLQEYIELLFSIDPTIELNGVINEKAKEDLYDYSKTEWLQILKVYKLYGSVDIEFVREFDKVLLGGGNKEEILDVFDNNIEQLEKFLVICAIKDYKPRRLEDLEKAIVELSAKERRLVAAGYVERIQHLREDICNLLKSSLQKASLTEQEIHDILTAKQQGVSISARKELLRDLQIIPELHHELSERAAAKDVSYVLNYMRQKVKAEQEELQNSKNKLPKLQNYTIEELYFITLLVKQTDMMKRNSDFKRLNLPGIITTEEQLLVQETMNAVNRYSHEKGFKRASTVKQFLMANCINAFMGFDKQSKDCWSATSPGSLGQFQSVNSLPQIAHYGQLNPEIALNLLPVFSSYIFNKYIQRNQLTLNEALVLMRSLTKLSAIYKEHNLKYQSKEFVYAFKTATRLVTDTFLRRIYSDFDSAKASNKKTENPFFERSEVNHVKDKTKEQKEKAEIIQNLTDSELDQVLEVFEFANEINVGSKEFYEAVDSLIVVYYEKFNISQKARAAYLLSTLECNNEQIEKLVETSIEKATTLTLTESVQFLSYLTARYCLNEDLWKKLINVVEDSDKTNNLTLQQLPLHLKQTLYLTKECLYLEQKHISFSLSSSTIDNLRKAFEDKAREELSIQTKFSEAIGYFLVRLGYYYEANEKVSIFIPRYSQLQTRSVILILDKSSFVGDTKAQRASVSVMIRMLTKLDYKLKLMNVYDWAAKEKRSEKVAYLRSKVKGMTFDAEKQKRKSYFNF